MIQSYTGESYTVESCLAAPAEEKIVQIFAPRLAVFSQILRLLPMSDAEAERNPDGNG
jgi:hypothetical protein